MLHKWVEEEMAELDIGDKRLEKRAKNVLQSIMNKPSMAFSQQFNSGAELKACYRLFNSDLVSSKTLLEPHFKRTLERIKLCKTVVIASDSSSLNYTTRLSNEDSGYISSNNAQGFLMHTSLVTTLDRQPLGIVSTKFWARNKRKPEKKIHRDYLPIEEKESYKWIESYLTANEVAKQCPDTEVINVADREADIIELWEEAIKAQKEKTAAHLVVRCNHDRAVVPTKENNSRKLFSFEKKTPVVGHCEFELRDRNSNSVIRKVKQEVRASSVCIRPADRSGVKAREVTLNLILMQEVDPPEGVKPVVWHLLTTLPVNNKEDMEKVIQIYLSRWDIEVLFRTFKTGCKVEERSLRAADRLYPMFALFLIVSWRINCLSRISRANPELPCIVIFSEMEWKAAYAAINKSIEPSKTVPTVREMLIMVAKLGGYLNRKNDPEPGAKVIWRGLEYLRTFMDAWELMQPPVDAKNEISVKKTCG